MLNQNLEKSVRSSPQIHWPSVAQFGLSTLATLMLWLLAISMVFIGVIQRLNPDYGAMDPLQPLLMAAGLFVSGLLATPSALHALVRIIGKPSPIAKSSVLKRLMPLFALYVFPVVLLLGYWVAGKPSLALLLLPAFHVLAIGLPVLWLTYIGQRNLPLSSPQRRWGIFSSGLILAPAVTLIAEIVALGGIVLLAAIWITGQPGLAEEIQNLAQSLTIQRTSPEAIRQMVEPFIASPTVLLAVLIYGAVVVPLIEELIKPVGVWLLAGFSLSPAEGFVAGVLSGAGYALFESLALVTTSQEWALLVLARIGTAIIHIVTTGLTGWALASAWREGRYLKLGFTYLLAVTIHALWNGLTLASVFTTVANLRSPSTFNRIILGLSNATPFGLLTLAIGAFTILVIANRVFQRPSPIEATLPNESA